MFVEHKEQGEVTEAPAKITKLSEAIRIGAKLRPQGMGFYFSEGRSCALGAAYEAVTGKYHEAGAGTDIPNMVDWFSEKFDMGPSLGSRIVDMNDGNHGQIQRTREQVADWLESQGR